MSIVGSEQWMYNPGGDFYGFPIEQSLRFNDNDSAYLNRNVLSAGNRKTFTISCWVKRANFGLQGVYSARQVKDDTTALIFESDNKLVFTDRPSNVRNIELRTNALFRDVGAWYHIVIKIDTTQATASDRAKMYVNGEEQTSFTTANYPSLNYDVAFWNNAYNHVIGYVQDNSPNYFDGYVADFNFIDGQALDPTSFGEFKSGIWIPKDTSGLTFGTNGFRLEYANSAAIGDDTSGNTNDWTVNNLVASDVVLDSPTNNFATHNPLASLGGMIFTEGNLEVRHADIAAYNHARSTMGMTSGKWYWEWYNSASSGDAPNLLSGIVNDNVPISTSNGYVGQNTNSYSYNVTTGARYYNNSNIGTISVPTGDSSGVYMVAYDADNGDLYFGANGTWANSGNPATGTGALFTGIDTDTTWYPAGYTINNDAGRWREVVVNHGQDSTFAGNKTAGGNQDDNDIGDFYYSPPSGFVAICTANLPTGAINTLADETPEDYFNTVLYTGNGTAIGSGGNAITGVGFQPDWVWIKERSGLASHGLYDVVRGVTKQLESDTTAAETTESEGLTTFGTDGFTVGSLAQVNTNTDTYAAWNWKANGSGVSNTDGSITSTVSVGATSQQNWFSIVKYTGSGGSDDYGHGLGIAPNMVITKDMTDPANWAVYVSEIGTGKYLQLNLTAATVTNPVIYPSVSSTTIGVGVQGDGSITNTSGDNYISYCLANAEGLCKVGSYVGNGSTDGPMIFTGHKPAWVMIKNTDVSTHHWSIYDNKRGPYNAIDPFIYANTSSVEGNTGDQIDFLSNGFKARKNDWNLNTSGVTYIYLAIAEQPFKYANAR